MTGEIFVEFRNISHYIWLYISALHFLGMREKHSIDYKLSTNNSILTFIFDRNIQNSGYKEFVKHNWYILPLSQRTCGCNSVIPADVNGYLIHIRNVFTLTCTSYFRFKVSAGDLCCSHTEEIVLHTHPLDVSNIWFLYNLWQHYLNNSLGNKIMNS